MKVIKLFLGIMIIIEISLTVFTEAVQVNYANLGKDVTLPCGVNIANPEEINAIGWQYNNGKDPIIILNKDGTTIVTTNENFKDRLEMIFPTGDLKISNIDISDEGIFNCLLVINSFVEETNGTYDLKVIEIPNDVSIICTVGDLRNSELKLCRDVTENEEIKSIACEVISRPRTKLSWHERPACEKVKQFEETTCVDNSGIFTCKNNISFIEDVCNGTYQCSAVASFGSIEKLIFSESYVLERASSDSFLYVVIGIALAALFIVIITAIVAVIIMINRRKSNTEKSNSEQTKEEITSLRNQENEENPQPNDILSEDKTDSKQPYEGDLVLLGSRESTGERSNSIEMKLGRNEDVRLLNLDLRLNENDNTRQYNQNNPRFTHIVSNAMKHNRRLKLKHQVKEPDGTERIWEIESSVRKPRNDDFESGDVNPRLI